MCEEIAVVSDLPAPPSQAALSRRLRQLGLLRKEKKKKIKSKVAAGGGGGGGSRAAVPAALLRELYGQYKDHPDALNQITARLPGRLSPKQVRPSILVWGDSVGKCTVALV